MWSYYGSKSKIVHLYPKPKFNKIIEPFAGTARYSLLYWDHDVTLVDKYDVVVKIWKWLQQCSKQDILSLPKLKRGDRISREMFDCDEQFWLMGFMVCQAVGTPRYKVSSMATSRKDKMEKQKRSIARQLHKIRHWKVAQGDYSCLANVEATWFVDPPYTNGGQYQYKHNNKDIDYGFLKIWCKERNGQVIVCENTKANWLPFSPLSRKNKGAANTYTTEAIWSNYPTDYDVTQLSLLEDLYGKDS